MDSYYQKWALDLFCGAGGATRGLQQAGFRVVGVDIKPQPRYCGDKFIQASVFDVPDWFQYDFIWASPPCQPFTVLGGREDLSKYEDLVEPVRERLQRTGRPWVMENVVGAPLRADLTLCANSFGLRSYRHRIFECSFPVRQPAHKPHTGSRESPQREPAPALGQRRPHYDHWRYRPLHRPGSHGYRLDER